MAEPTQPLTSPSDDKAYDWFAILLLLGTFGFVALTFWKQPQMPGDMFGAVVGYMFAQIQQIVGFRWGNSAASQQKDATIHNLSKP